MQNTTNVFSEGLMMDRHPLTTPQQCMTDALNATLVTFNGNEMMLLNDMGNTKIQDKKTGNLMGLREGFIPVGMKEHGGIMYIASVNKDGEGEIGTIPSPVIEFNKEASKNIVFSNDQSLTVGPNLESDLIVITDSTISAGEKFCVSINMLDTNSINYPLPLVETGEEINKEYPLYTTYNKQGLYKVNLYSLTDKKQYSLNEYIESDTSYLYVMKGESQDFDKSTWFACMKSTKELDFDIESMNISENKGTLAYIHYPNIPEGKIAISLSSEKMNSFSLITNSETGVSHPCTYFNPTTKDYYAVFNGFNFSTSSAVHADRVKIKVYDSDGNQKQIESDFISGSTDELTLTIGLTINGNLIDRLLKYCSSDSDLFYLLRNRTILSNNKSNPDFSKTSKSNALFTVNIGKDLNKWFTLEVQYYSLRFNNDLLGTYTLDFNLQVMDVDHQFVEYTLEPETNWEHETNDDGEDGYFLLYYIPSLQEDDIITKNEPLFKKSSIRVSSFKDINNENVDNHIKNGLALFYLPQNGIKKSELKDLNLTNYLYLYNEFSQEISLGTYKYTIDTSSSINNPNFSWKLTWDFGNEALALVSSNGSTDYNNWTIPTYLQIGSYTISPEYESVTWDLDKSTATLTCTGNFKVKDNDIVKEGIEYCDQTDSENSIDIIFNITLRNITGTTANSSKVVSNPARLLTITDFNISEITILNDTLTLLSINNKSSYKLCPQFNLVGRDYSKDSLYSPYGVLKMNGLAVISQCNLITYYNYLSGVLSQKGQRENSSSIMYQSPNYVLCTENVSNWDDTYTYLKVFNPGIYYLNVNFIGGYLKFIFKDTVSNEELSIDFSTVSNPLEEVVLVFSNKTILLKILAKAGKDNGSNSTRTMVSSLGMYLLKDNLPYSSFDNDDLLDVSTQTLKAYKNHNHQYAIPLLAIPYYERDKNYDTSSTDTTWKASCLGKKYYYDFGPNHAYQKIGLGFSIYPHYYYHYDWSDENLLTLPAIKIQNTEIIKENSIKYRKEV